MMLDSVGGPPKLQGKSAIYAERQFGEKQKYFSGQVYAGEEIFCNGSGS
jgi:hypothetical protein